MKMTIELTYYKEEETFQVDVYRDKSPMYSFCETIEIDADNNYSDSLTVALNYIHEVVLGKVKDEFVENKPND